MATILTRRSTWDRTGPDRAARLLEIVVAVRSDGSEVVIHAMKMQARYQLLLGHLEDSDA